MARGWVDAILAAGAVPVSYVPEASVGRKADAAEVAVAQLVEDAEVRIHRVDAAAPAPAAVSFLDGIQRWRVVAQSGVVPLVRAYVAAAVRRRGGDRRLRTTAERWMEFAITHVEALAAPVRRALEDSGVTVVNLAATDVGQPSRTLRAAHVQVDRAREELERQLGERCATDLRDGEWLIVDGLLSESELLARHPRALGVIKSHGAQFFSGADLERALTVPAGHRTSVFAPQSHAHQPIYSWYVRLWPWEGNDLLYGLLRIEARAHRETVAAASGASGWLVRERAPVSTPDERWDRLLYAIHDVETYLKARAPRDFLAPTASRLPRAAS